MMGRGAGTIQANQARTRGCFRSQADPYRVLGLTPSADDMAVIHAYRRLARQLHPDLNHAPTAAREFQAVQAAYETVQAERRAAALLQAAQAAVAVRQAAQNTEDVRRRAAEPVEHDQQHSTQHIAEQAKHAMQQALADAAELERELAAVLERTQRPPERRTSSPQPASQTDPLTAHARYRQSSESAREKIVDTTA